MHIELNPFQNKDKKILDAYQDHLDVLQNFIGFELTEIEKIGLMRIVEEVLKQVETERRENISTHDRISDYYGEVLSRWFPHFYDIRYEDLPLKLDEATREYLRRKQQEAHLL